MYIVVDLYNVYYQFSACSPSQSHVVHGNKGLMSTDTTSFEIMYYENYRFSVYCILILEKALTLFPQNC